MLTTTWVTTNWLMKVEVYCNNYLNVNIKYTPSQAAICFVISEHYLRKMEVYCVISISHTKSIISKRERRKARIRVQFTVGHREPGWLLHSINVSIIILIQEVTSAAKCPVFWTRPVEFWRSTWFCISIIFSSFNGYFFSAAIYMSVWFWDKSNNRLVTTKQVDVIEFIFI
jgi:hypothetical protein